MPPMDLKEWWLAAAAATSVVAPLAEAAPSAGDKVGVVSAARPAVRSSTGDRVIYVGDNVLFGERLKTDSTGVIHILFMDQSSITIGPNSEATILDFAYRPEKQEGNIAVNLLKGALRVVGGLISKNNPTKVTTTTATIGIRGGITLVEADDRQTRGIFLFGKQMEIATPDGANSRLVTRPGFGVTSGPNGLGLPIRVAAEEFAGLLRQMESRPVAGGPAGPAGGTRPGQLVSTNDRPTGGKTPRKTLAIDRLDTATVDINTGTPKESLRDVLGSSPTAAQS